jgi:hypothetical protein
MLTRDQYIQVDKELFNLLVLICLSHMSNTWLPVDVSMVVRCVSRVLGDDGGQVVRPWVGWAHNAARERQLLMPGVTHHQSSRSLATYGQAWVRKIISLFKRSILLDFY